MKTGQTIEHGNIAHVNVSSARVEKLLTWWANIALGAEREGVSESYRIEEAEKLVKKFPDMFLSESIFQSDQMIAPSKTSRLSTEQLHSLYLSRIYKLAQKLREVWDASYTRRSKLAVWLHYWVLELFINPQSGWTPQEYIESGRGGDDPLDFLLVFLVNNLQRLRHCPNPSCRAPYFLASKGNSRYCSESCADYGRQQSQTRYWNAVGSKNRKARMAKVRKVKIQPSQTRR
jgi:hypothetical protein